jgi:hypothetical protein
MAKPNPLQEQLLKAGLVKKGKVAEAVREQVKARHGKAPPSPTATATWPFLTTPALSSWSWTGVGLATGGASGGGRGNDTQRPREHGSGSIGGRRESSRL